MTIKALYIGGDKTPPERKGGGHPRQHRHGRTDVSLNNHARRRVKGIEKSFFAAAYEKLLLAPNHAVEVRLLTRFAA